MDKPISRYYKQNLGSFDDSRTMQTEHSEPTPVRGCNKDARRNEYHRNPVSNGTRTVATPVKTLWRNKDGRIVEKRGKQSYTDADIAAAEREYRRERLYEILNGQVAQVDTWAAHS